MNSNRFQIVPPPQSPLAAKPVRDVGAGPVTHPARRRPSKAAVLFAVGFTGFGMAAAALFYLAWELWP